MNSGDNYLDIHRGPPWEAWQFCVHIWDAFTGVEIRRLRGHRGFIAGIDIAPDGRRLASVSYDKSVRIWDIETGTLLHRFRLRWRSWQWNRSIYSVLFSPDGQLILSTSAHREVGIWNATNGAEIGRLRLEEAVSLLDVSPDSRRLLIRTKSGAIQIRDLSSGVHLTSLRGHEQFVSSAAFSPDGKRVVGCSDHTVRTWDANSGVECLCLRESKGPVKNVVLSQDGKRIASGSKDQSGGYVFSDDDVDTVLVWDAAGGACLDVLYGSGDLAAIAAGPTFPYRALERGTETVIESTATGVAVAWLPMAVARITTHPSGRAWAGVLGEHLTLFTLEEQPFA